MDYVDNQKSKKSFIEVFIIHLVLIFTCWVVVSILGSFVTYGVIIQKKMSEKYTYITQQNIDKVKQEILEEIKTEYQNNESKLTKDYLNYVFKENPILLLWNNFAWVLCFILPGYWFLNKKLQIQVNLFLDSFDPTYILQGMSSGFFLFMLVTLIALLLKLLGYEPAPIETQSILLKSIYQNTSLLVWSLYSVALITGIIEELFFRGFLLQHYIEEGWEKEGLLITSFLFGFIHYSPESSLFIPFLLSFVGYYFGSMYIQYRSIWVPIFTHTFFNASSLIFAYSIEQKNV